MKKTICLLSAITAFGSAHAQDAQVPEWRITVQVVDEANQPVTNATVKVAWHILPPPDQSIALTNVSGLTDQNGVYATVQRSGSIEVMCGAEKPGYYSAGRVHDFAKFRKNDPAKLNPWVTLVLRKIGNPIPMFAKKAETKVQKENEPVGFDLMAGDWVAPFGAGKIADMFFTAHRKIVNAQEYDAELKLTFPNKGDGIAVAPPEPDTGSDFRTPRFATESGYESEHVWHYSNAEQPESVSGYFLRVRTVLDEKGEVKSALYGKIRGDFRFYAGTKAPRAGMGFDYYLNPSPNDRNLEFDPKRNLFNGLAFDERLREP
jgi:hypothetical protein